MTIFKDYDQLDDVTVIYLETIEDSFNGVTVYSTEPQIDEWGWDYEFHVRFQHIIASHKYYGNTDYWKKTSYTQKIYEDPSKTIFNFWYVEYNDEWEIDYGDSKTIILLYDEELYDEIKASYNFVHLMNGVPSYNDVIDEMVMNGELEPPIITYDEEDDEDIEIIPLIEVKIEGKNYEQVFSFEEEIGKKDILWFEDPKPFDEEIINYWLKDNSIEVDDTFTFKGETYTSEMVM